MKRLNIAINLPDNGGITFFGPLTSSTSKAPINPNRHRMYISATSDPEEVGKVLMAMLADLQMSDNPVTDLDREIGEIQF